MFLCSRRFCQGSWLSFKSFEYGLISQHSLLTALLSGLLIALPFRLDRDLPLRLILNWLYNLQLLLRLLFLRLRWADLKKWIGVRFNEFPFMRSLRTWCSPKSDQAVHELLSFLFIGLIHASMMGLSQSLWFWWVILLVIRRIDNWLLRVSWF